MTALSMYLWVLYLCSCQWAWEHREHPVDVKHAIWWTKETARLTYQHYRGLNV